jgi:hypothetical protein
MIDKIYGRNRKTYIPVRYNTGSSKTTRIIFFNDSTETRRSRFSDTAKRSTRDVLTDKIKSKSKKTKKKRPFIGVPELPDSAPTGNIIQEDGKTGVMGGGPPKF